MNLNKRQNGILLPISSLPSKHGVGTLGKASFDFVDFLYKSNVQVWQMLPLNPTSYGDSPYQSFTSNGLNYYFIDLDILVDKKLLKKKKSMIKISIMMRERLTILYFLKIESSY